MKRDHVEDPAHLEFDAAPDANQHAGERQQHHRQVAGGTGAQALGSFMSDAGMSDDGAFGHIVNLPGNVDVHRTNVQKALDENI